MAAQTATISKYDKHQIISLDLQKKTYRTVDTSEQIETPPPEAPSKRASHSKSELSEQREQPGTAVVDLTLQARRSARKCSTASRPQATTTR